MFVSDKNSFLVLLSATHKLAPDVLLRSIGTAQSAPLPQSLRRTTGEYRKLATRFLLMPNKRKKPGRPQKTGAKRTKKIDVRFTEEEYKTIAALEETLGISKTELVRERLLHGARLTMMNAKELIAELDKIGTELGRSGNNINQLARYANALNKKGILSPPVADQFNRLFANHLERQRELETVLRKVIRALGH